MIWLAVTAVAKSRFSSQRSLSFKRSSVSPKTNLGPDGVAYSHTSNLSLIQVKYASTDSSTSYWRVQNVYRS